jgi:ubiquinol-cytochrome c reductase cytochrome c1 subunit
MGMFKTTALAIALGLGFGAANVAHAAGEAPEPPNLDWSFDGVFGTFDRAAAQRGLQVYLEVCSTCHSLDLVAYRNLADLGYSEEQVKAIAARYTVTDGPDENGEMFERPAIPADPFVAPFPNPEAARAANGGALPPDLSVIVQARAGGADYIHAFLTGFSEPPADVELMPGMNWNEYFPGHQVGMPDILMDGGVEFADGTEATAENQARAVTEFLAWTAEPHMEERKRMGAMVILFLIVFTGMMYAVKRKLWADVH